MTEPASFAWIYLLVPVALSLVGCQEPGSNEPSLPDPSTTSETMTPPDLPDEGSDESSTGGEPATPDVVEVCPEHGVEVEREVVVDGSELPLTLGGEGFIRFQYEPSCAATGTSQGDVAIGFRAPVSGTYWFHANTEPFLPISMSLLISNCADVSLTCDTGGTKFGPDTEVSLSQGQRVLIVLDTAETETDTDWSIRIDLD